MEQDLVTSLALCRKLLESGYTQGWTGVFSVATARPEQMKGGFGSCHFKWFSMPNTGEPIVSSMYCNYAMICEAPTAAEILNQLPKRDPVGTVGFNGHLICSPEHDGSWTVFYQKNFGGAQNEKTLADAAASMWLYLKKRNLLPPQS